MFRKLGFTMIELLIVIAVLGILAVAVLAAINPIEQINRGRDTGSRSDAEQLLSAVDRYYASKGYYPWMSGANSLNTATDTATSTDLVSLSGASPAVGKDSQNMMNLLSTGGSSELKSSFVSRIAASTYRALSIANDGVSGHSTYVCFSPQSGSFREEAYNRCKATLPSDFPALACPADSTCTSATTSETATGCYICLP